MLSACRGYTTRPPGGTPGSYLPLANLKSQTAKLLFCDASGLITFEDSVTFYASWQGGKQEVSHSGTGSPSLQAPKCRTSVQSGRSHVAAWGDGRGQQVAVRGLEVAQHSPETVVA